MGDHPCRKEGSSYPPPPQFDGDRSHPIPTIDLRRGQQLAAHQSDPEYFPGSGSLSSSTSNLRHGLERIVRSTTSGGDLLPHCHQIEHTVIWTGVGNGPFNIPRSAEVFNEDRARSALAETKGLRSCHCLEYFWGTNFFLRYLVLIPTSKIPETSFLASKMIDIVQY
jgi:hypothetical protein